MSQYKIPCLHESQGVPSRTKVADYYPLNKKEVERLLFIAKSAMGRGDVEVSIVSDIQCRLGQGIKGAVCPHDTSGRVAQLSVQLDKLFIDYMYDNLKGYSDQEVVAELMTLMQG